MELDAFDRRILTLLQKDNHMPQRDIAEAVGLSSSAVNRRIAALEAAGVIRANVAVVDPAKVGRPISIIVEVAVESERLDLLDQVRRRFEQSAAVQQVYYVTGDVDFVLVVTVAGEEAEPQDEEEGPADIDACVRQLRSLHMSENCPADRTFKRG